MKKLTQKVISMFMVGLLLTFPNVATAFASTQTNDYSSRKIISTQKSPNKEFHKKLDNITTFNSEDIEELSDVANITVNRQGDELTQYTIVEEEPSTIVTYSDGTIEQSKEVVALLVSTSYSEYDTSKSESNGDIKLKATMVYTEMSVAGDNWFATGIKMTAGKGCVVSFAERFRKNLKIECMGSGAAFDTSGNFIGFYRDGWTTRTVESPVVGTTYSYNTGFTHYFDKSQGAINIYVSCDVSHNGTDYYTYTVGFNMGSYTLPSPGDFN